MSLFTSMAQNHLDRKRLKEVAEELELMERCAKFAQITPEGFILIEQLKEERYAIVMRLSPPCFM